MILLRDGGAWAVPTSGSARNPEKTCPVEVAPRHPMAMRTLLAFLLLPTLAIAQRELPGPVHFGQGSRYTEPILAVPGNPQIGKTFTSTVHYLEMRPGGSAITHWIGFSVFGRSRTSWAGGKLPHLLQPTAPSRSRRISSTPSPSKARRRGHRIPGTREPTSTNSREPSDTPSRTTRDSSDCDSTIRSSSFTAGSIPTARCAVWQPAVASWRSSHRRLWITGTRGHQRARARPRSVEELHSRRGLEERPLPYPSVHARDRMQAYRSVAPSRAVDPGSHSAGEHRCAPFAYS